MKYPINREWLGRQVYKTWRNWAQSQFKSTCSWDELSEEDKEVGRQIGEAIAKIVVAGRFQCSDCEGTGVTDGVYNGNHLQPNLCRGCEGNGVKFLPPHCQITAPVNSDYKAFEQLDFGDVFKFPWTGSIWIKVSHSSYQKVGEKECYGIDLQNTQVVQLHLGEWNCGGFFSTNV